jgi:hypothetical protein
MGRFADDPLYIPRELVLELLVDLSKVSPIRCGRLELDARLSIVK